MPEFTYTEKWSLPTFQPNVPYNWQIITASEGISSQKNTPFLDIKCQEMESGGTWSLTLYFTPKTFPQLSRFAHSCGVTRGEGEILKLDESVLKGRIFSAELQEEVWTNGEKSGKTLKFNPFTFEQPTVDVGDTPSPKLPKADKQEVAW
jgi:hypothetical protein